jgi:hypothetical protein
MRWKPLASASLELVPVTEAPCAKLVAPSLIEAIGSKSTLDQVVGQDGPVRPYQGEEGPLILVGGAGV